MATDQLSELERKVSRLEQELDEAKNRQVAQLDNMSQTEEELSRAVNMAAARIESLADGLSKSLRSQENS